MITFDTIEKEYLNKNTPSFSIGDTIRIDVNIQEGDKKRIQSFEGTVIAKKHGGINETFTVRRISYGVGVERIFPVHSPHIAAIKVIKKGRVRRSKLYYLRNRVGKSTKVREKL